MQQRLTAQIVNVGSRGIELNGGFYRLQRLLEFPLPLICLGQTQIRILQSWIKPQCFAIIFRRIIVLLRERIDVSQFFIVESDVGFDCGFLQKLIARIFVVLFF